MRPRFSPKLFCAIVLLVPFLSGAQTPIFLPGGPDAAAYGATDRYPIGSPQNFFEMRYMVGSYSHFDRLFPFHTVGPAARPWNFQQAASAPDIAYFYGGNRYTLRDYLSRMPVTGLLVAKND